jgi:hypothetical protein
MKEANARPARAAAEGRAGSRGSKSREESFSRLLRLACRDDRARALVASVLEGTILEPDRRAAILRDFLAAGAAGTSDPD